jgi:hypothetical protein
VARQIYGGVRILVAEIEASGGVAGGNARLRNRQVRGTSPAPRCDWSLSIDRALGEL